jgi:hypothetical protein
MKDQGLTNIDGGTSDALFNDINNPTLKQLTNERNDIMPKKIENALKAIKTKGTANFVDIRVLNLMVNKYLKATECNDIYTHLSKILDTMEPIGTQAVIKDGSDWVTIKCSKGQFDFLNTLVYGNISKLKKLEDKFDKARADIDKAEERDKQNPTSPYVGEALSNINAKLADLEQQMALADTMIEVSKSLYKAYTEYDFVEYVPPVNVTSSQDVASSIRERYTKDSYKQDLDLATA